MISLQPIVSIFVRHIIRIYQKYEILSMQRTRFPSCGIQYGIILSVDMTLALRSRSSCGYLMFFCTIPNSYSVGIVFRSSLFCGSTAVLRSIQKNLIRVKRLNIPYYLLYTHGTDLILVFTNYFINVKFKEFLISLQLTKK